MRTMVRAVMRQESKVRKGIDPDIGIGTTLRTVVSPGRTLRARSVRPGETTARRVPWHWHRRKPEKQWEGTGR